jgi:DNA-directed RNA polymerase subunit K/omega
MLAKTAEAHALARAFPQETSDLEIAAADQEWRQQQVQLAERQAQIYGADEDHSPYELPDGRMVDTVSGEVLEEGNSAQDPTNPGPSGAVAAAHSPPSPPSESPVADKYRRNRELVKRAREMGVAGFEPLKLGQAQDVVDAANLELEDRIARAEWERDEVARQKMSEGLL